MPGESDPQPSTGLRDLLAGSPRTVSTERQPERRSGQRRTQPSRVVLGAVVLMPAIAGAGLATALGDDYARAQYRASGAIALTEIAGNRPAYELNVYAADLETALTGPLVATAVADALPPELDITPIEVSRLADASRVSYTLAVGDRSAARRALVVAGRTAYRVVVEQQIDLLEVRDTAAARRLEELAADTGRLRRAAAAAPVGQRETLEAQVEQQEQAVGLVVQDRARVRNDLAVARAVTAGLDRSGAVRVEAVERLTVLPQVLRVGLTGLLGGALAGVMAAYALLRRATGSGRRSTGTTASPAPAQVEPAAPATTPAPAPTPAPVTVFRDGQADAAREPVPAEAQAPRVRRL